MTTGETMTDKIDIASKELCLNMEKQKIRIFEPVQLGYKWDEQTVVFQFMIPKKYLPIKIKSKPANTSLCRSPPKRK